MFIHLRSKFARYLPPYLSPKLVSNLHLLFHLSQLAIQEMENARLRSIMFSNSDDSHEDMPEGSIADTPVKDGDDDAAAPSWFKHVNATNSIVGLHLVPSFAAEQVY